MKPYFLQYVCLLCASRCQQQQNSGILVEYECYRGVIFCNICPFRQEWMISVGTDVSKDSFRVFILQIFLSNGEFSFKMIQNLQDNHHQRHKKSAHESLMWQQND